jgi:hypothetical protein
MPKQSDQVPNESNWIDRKITFVCRGSHPHQRHRDLLFCSYLAVQPSAREQISMTCGRHRKTRWEFGIRDW